MHHQDAQKLLAFLSELADAIVVQTDYIVPLSEAADRRYRILNENLPKGHLWTTVLYALSWGYTETGCGRTGLTETGLKTVVRHRMPLEEKVALFRKEREERAAASESRNKATT